MRRKVKNRNMVAPDFIYNSQKLEKFINYIMWSGRRDCSKGDVCHFDVIKKSKPIESTRSV